LFTDISDLSPSATMIDIINKVIIASVLIVINQSEVIGQNAERPVPGLR